MRCGLGPWVSLGPPPQWQGGAPRVRHDDTGKLTAEGQEDGARGRYEDKSDALLTPDKVTPGQGAEQDRATQGQSSQPPEAALPGCAPTVGHTTEATEKSAKAPKEQKGEADSR